MTLFNLIPEHHALLDLIGEQPGGELAPDVEANLDAFFAEIADAEAVKLDSYAGVIRTLESQAIAAQAEIDQFAAKKRTAENAVKRLKDRVKLYLEVTGRTKATTAAGRTFAIQKNGGKPALEFVGDVPAEFLIQPPPVPDGDAIRVALAAGREVDGVRLSPVGTHLRIR